MSLENYELGERLWRDERCAVYRAHQRGSGRSVILKMPLEESTHPQLLENLRRDYELSSQIFSPRILKVIALESQGGRWALVLEDFPGSPLSTLVQESLPALDSCRIAIGICEVLESIHDQGFLHRDIKPSNVIVDLQAWDVRLTGFSLEGTLAYMAPEQTGRTGHETDRRSDLYSLGCLLYEMTTGSLPFRATDRLGLVHSHIAVAPAPPQGVPKPLSALILKLLAKDPEERYQSARGVRQDLLLILNALNQGEELSAFRLGRQDGRDTLAFPLKPFGREGEIQALLKAFEFCASGGRSSVFITGAEGVGKSSLVREAITRAGESPHLFVSGGWEASGGGVPHSGIVLALNDAIRKLLTGGRQSWKATQESLGSGVAVLAKSLPQFHLLFEKSEAVVGDDDDESEARFPIAAEQFLRTLARPERPLVIFFDDLHKADPWSLDILREVLEDSEVRHLLFIGAWRPQEVESGHPVAKFVERLRRGSAVSQLHLNSLTVQDLKSFLAETLREEHETVGLLAQLTHSRTQGSPALLRPFLKSLVDQKLIRHEEGHWTWNMGRIREQGVNEGVIELAISRIPNLEKSEQELLRLASCLGGEFDLQDLAVVSQLDSHAVSQALLPILREELMIELHGRRQDLAGLSETSYTFLHEKIQKAAYQTIPEAERWELHSRIGWRLLENSKNTDSEERLGEIVEHLNQGHSCIASHEMRQKLAHLNLRAAVKARRSTSYDEAKTWLEKGLSLLPSGRDPFEECYDLTFQLNLERARIASLLQEYEETDQRVDLLLENVTTDLDRIAVLEVQLLCSVNRGQWESVLRIGWSALEILKEGPPQEWSRGRLWLETAGLERRLKQFSTEALSRLPEMVNTQTQAALRILRAMGVAAYFVRPDLYPSIVCRMVRLSLSYGNCGDSAYGYAGYAFVLAAYFGRYRRASEVGRASLEIVERYQAEHLKGQVQFVVSASIRPWTDSYQSTYGPLAEAGRVSLAQGSTPFGDTCLFWSYCQELFAGRPLGGLQKKLESTNGALLRSLYELVEELSCGKVAEWSSRSEQPEAANLPGFANGYRAIGRYLLGDPGGCLEQVDLYRVHRDALRGQSCLPVFLYYEALARLSLVGRGSTARQAIKATSRTLSQLQGWAKSCPVNYLAKMLIVQAEAGRVRGKPFSVVMTQFQEGIRQARLQGHLHDEALAHELAGRYCDSFGFEVESRAHLELALSLYLQWGAVAVARRLAREYPELDPHLTRLLQFEVPADSVAESLDLSAMVEAAQALSQEIVLERLLRTLTRLLLQNSGAERAVLVLRDEESFRVQAEARLDFSRVEQGETVEQSERLSRSVTGFVLRTGEPVVLDDALEGDFRHDRYLLSTKVRSVLCTPLVRRGEVAGALYLENNQSCGVFTKERLRIVQVLASQAAISLENARHFQKQQNQHEEILREREARHLEEMRGKELTVRKDTLAGFLGIAAHDLRNALVAIQMWTRQLSGDRVGQQVERARGLIEDACTHAHGLIRSYLDASEVEVSGRLVLRLAPFSLDGLIRKTMSAQFESLPDERRAQVTLSDTLDSVVVVGDQERVAQVLVNLLSNALLYCPGAVTLKLNLVKTGESVRFDLRDNGPGVTLSQAQDLFEPFRRACSGGDGRGLGLWICKVIVEAHGGQIGIDSASSGGHFWFELPVTAAS